MIAVEIDSIRHHTPTVRGETESLRHEFAKIAARCDEQIHVTRARGERPPHLAAHRLGHRVEKRVLALPRANHARAQLVPQTPREADEHRVRQADHVGLRLRPQPREQLFQLTRLIALLAAQHRERQVADLRRARFRRTTRREFQERGRRQQIVQPLRRAPKRWENLLEVNLDPVEKNRRRRALIFLVERHRQIQRHQQRRVPLPAQLRDEGVVAETIPAIHAARAGGELDDVHLGSVRIVEKNHGRRASRIAARSRLPWRNAASTTVSPAKSQYST